MVFSSAIFLFLFLPVVLILYFCVKKTNSKNNILLIASLIFYAWGQPFYIFLLLGSIAINWKLGLLVEPNAGQSRKIWIVVAVIINILILFIFKYLGFIADNFNLIWGTDININIPLPIGISFFTFQALSYVIDVYRGNGTPQKRFKDVALYISLFPQLIAGPIVRYETIAEQLNNRTVNFDKFTIGGNYSVLP